MEVCCLRTGESLPERESRCGCEDGRGESGGICRKTWGLPWPGGGRGSGDRVGTQFGIGVSRAEWGDRIGMGGIRRRRDAAITASALAEPSLPP